MPKTEESVASEIVLLIRTARDVYHLDVKNIHSIVNSEVCHHCGCDQPETGRRCQCWNDE